MQVVNSEDLNVFALSKYDKTIFLAGPCPRKDYDKDWRYEAIEIFKQLGFDGTIFNPTNPSYDVDDPNYLTKQTLWETTAMDLADAIVFWIPRTQENPAMTTNIEFGEHFNEDKSIVGMPDYAIKNEYLKVRLGLIGKKWYETLEETIRAAVNYVNEARER